MAEFAANKNELASTKFFLFFATKDLYFYMSFDKVKLSNVKFLTKKP